MSSMLFFPSRYNIKMQIGAFPFSVSVFVIVLVACEFYSTCEVQGRDCHCQGYALRYAKCNVMMSSTMDTLSTHCVSARGVVRR